MAFVVALVDVTRTLVVYPEDRPQRLHLALSFVWFVLHLSHFPRQFRYDRLDRLPSLWRWSPSGFGEFGHRVTCTVDESTAFLDEDLEGSEDEEYWAPAEKGDPWDTSPQVLINKNAIAAGRRTLVIATHPSASALFRPKFMKRQPVGVILSSEVDLSEENFVRTQNSSGASIYVYDASTVVVLCQSPVHHEASSWVNALAAEIKPES